VKRHRVWECAAEWAGRTLTDQQLVLLDRYRDWLLEEATVAGGIGPDESARIDSRHIGDSLLFSFALGNPVSVVDVGSGVGLPGIPLAILLPRAEFVLIDRSGRRVDLMRRATSILDLKNVQVFHGEIDDLGATWPALVSRATLSPKMAAQRFPRFLDSGGVAVLGGSWVESPDFSDWETVSVPSRVLDHEVWLLIMHRS
jgi:16S rRNA (guanine527-N7)-methyltransferase